VQDIVAKSGPPNHEAFAKNVAKAVALWDEGKVALP